MKTRSHNSKRLLVLYAIGFVFAGCGFAIAQDDSASPDGRRGSGLIVVAEANSLYGRRFNDARSQTAASRRRAGSNEEHCAGRLEPFRSGRERQRARSSPFEREGGRGAQIASAGGDGPAPRSRRSALPARMKGALVRQFLDCTNRALASQPGQWEGSMIEDKQNDASTTDPRDLGRRTVMKVGLAAAMAVLAKLATNAASAETALPKTNTKYNKLPSQAKANTKYTKYTKSLPNGGALGGPDTTQRKQK